MPRAYCLTPSAWPGLGPRPTLPYTLLPSVRSSRVFRRHNLLALLAAILAPLAGCGLKGDLYLPDEERQPTVLEQLEEELSEEEDVSGKQQQR